MWLTTQGPRIILSTSADADLESPIAKNWFGTQGNPGQFKRSASEDLLPLYARAQKNVYEEAHQMSTSPASERSNSPPLVSTSEAVNRAISLSKKLSVSNIPSHITDTGDLMLDMTGYKSSEEDALRAEVIARKILAEELEGNYDIGALIGADEQGNLWIYSSGDAKVAAGRKVGLQGLNPSAIISDSASDPGYHSDEEGLVANRPTTPRHHRTQSDASPNGLLTPPKSPSAQNSSSGDPNRNYAKTLRLTSDQLKALELKPGPNKMSFSVNRATCHAFMYYWTYDVPIVISDIDGTITK